jgi:hypothetical protein
MIPTRAATTQNDVVSDDAEAIPPITPGVTRPTRVGDDGDAGNAARGMGAYASGSGEHERDDDGEADPEEREAEEADRKAGRQHDRDGAGESARPRDAVSTSCSRPPGSRVRAARTTRRRGLTF